MSERFLSKEEVRSFYDRFGSKQDWQRFYEGPALRSLLLHSRMGQAASVFELGCGTGAFALDLLRKHLPESASYVGVDMSSSMVALTRQKLTHFAERSKVVQTDGSLRFDFPDGSFDRFIANYVLDLLSPDDIITVLSEAQRLLRSGGLLCLVSLTAGQTTVSRVITRLWRCVHNRNPGLVGGCRPLELRAFFHDDQWGRIFHGVVNSLGIASEIVIAAKNSRNTVGI
ncbi:MAG: class I SAM-dependent methyltransferase [Geobacteraceae bacterium]